MKFMLILTHVESAWEKAASGEAERVYQAYMAIEGDMKARGVLVESMRLRPSSEARTIRNLPAGKRSFADGPHTKTDEVMGGYYVLECGSMEEALEWAKRLPNYGHGSIEIRPIWT